MTMKPIKRAVVKTGEYTDAQGNKKSRYQNVGTMLKRDDGSVVVKMDCIPLGVAEVWINFYDLDDKQQNEPPGQ